MLKKQIEQDLLTVVKNLGFKSVSDPVVYISENSDFGDYTSNIALQLSKQNSKKSYQSPRELANEIVEKLNHPYYAHNIEIAGPGFINFFIKNEVLSKELEEITFEKEFFGSNKKKVSEKVQVEFISANPTGPLTLPNGRGGVIGDTLANVLATQGYEVEREYYVNDAGNQVLKLGEAVLAAAGKIEEKEDHYKGEYVKELVTKFSDKLDLEAEELGHLVAEYLLKEEIKPAVKKMGINYDNYFSEKSLYKGKIEKALEAVKKSGYTFEKDGALWLKTTEFGDDQDRVLLTSQENKGKNVPTYFLADIAYHLDVFDRGFDKKINVWGADHHGYIARMKAAMEALGKKDQPEIIEMQMVKLFREGKEVRMSKRAGTYVTLNELLDEVSSDVARFFLLMYSPNSHINFNLDLAKEQSNNNPVFYVQYAYARMSSILKKAENTGSGADVTLLCEKAERELIKHLLEYPDLIEEISKTYEVHKLTTFAIKIADLFHHFYETCSVLHAATPELERARVELVLAAKIVLGNTLDLLGINAPEKM